MKPRSRSAAYPVEWIKLSRDFLEESPWCWGCLSIGVRTRATVLDHVVPVTEAPERVLDIKNLQPVCSRCHNVIKRQLETDWRNGRISAAALRMGSPEAIRAVRRYHKPAIGVDGMPIQGT